MMGRLGTYGVCLIIVFLKGVHSSPTLSKDGDAGTPQKEDPYICCVPDSWAARMYLTYGNIYADGKRSTDGVDAVINGTVQLAYSYLKKKAYVQIQANGLSLSTPKPIPGNTTLLYDFSAGKFYQVNDGECDDIGDLDYDMPRQCIPSQAKHLGTGKFGNGNITISTYQYGIDTLSTFQMTATVHKYATSGIMPMPCDPIHVEYMTPGLGVHGNAMLIGLDIMDKGPIRDESVFEIPEACR